MDERPDRQPLLSKDSRDYGLGNKNVGFLRLSLKYGLKLVMWVIFLTWVTVIFLFPSDFMGEMFEKWIMMTRGTIFGVSGSIFLLFSAPILAIALLGTLYIGLFPREYNERKRNRSPSLRLWTFPVLVDGPFGVVSAAEFIGIAVFFLYILWATSAYARKDSRLVAFLDVSSREKICFMLDLVGLHFGSIGLFCTAFLFLPISRGSILLRLIDIPFEHATRYHVWLGHVTMILFTLHGLCYVISWSIQGTLQPKLIEWRDIGVANLPGVISLLAGLLMWVTSFSPVRKNFFELFFYTHQLYVVFIIFLALHVGDFIFYMAGGAIFLFVLDRFLRFCQSRATVDVLSAKCLPCGTVELTLSKPQKMRYSALGFVFLQVRELSWLQWHPFSVSSSPLDGGFHMSVLIKVLGHWTEKLRDSILSGTNRDFNISASVEGPYGHESPYYLQYENLILVAGGIGISPFIAIVRDILHRVKERRTCLPKNILIVWSVKRTKELSLLSKIDATSLCAFFPKVLNVEVQTYVTQETEKPLEEGNLSRNKTVAHFPRIRGSSMSTLVGTGNMIWSGLYLFSSIVGFIVLIALVELLYIRRFNKSTWWLQGLLCIICMLASVILFGGTVIMLWRCWESSPVGHDQHKDSGLQNEPTDYDEETSENLVSLGSNHYGQRPNFTGIFSSISGKWGNVDVGVLVCGPPGLQTSVAAECRSQNLKSRWDHPIFHFHTHSFDL
ncbi:ferric reduction oxidase 7, chloroplastic-like [Nymphaea colorata]|nr:ferric reduction oxidase 7, chloroplastic-like [Nymphaea colorata]